jgi:hypothetical protein
VGKHSGAPLYISMIYMRSLWTDVNHSDIQPGMAAETKSKQILIRVRPSLKEVAEKAAKEDNRSLSALIEKLLIDYLRKKGLLKA